MIEFPKKKIKINIIPLIDIIFLMLVFFMLATNFSEKKELGFSIQKEIADLTAQQNNLIINIIENKYFISDKEIKPSLIEKELLSFWESKKFKNVVILNDDVSNLQELIFLVDLLNKNRIENFTFSDDPKL
jgi:biopolymer transport protein ExbD